jgi:glyoxylate/hydroxypyruvate reductase A
MAIECPIYINSEDAFADSGSTANWITTFADQSPHLGVKHWQDVERPLEVKYAIVWHPHEALFQRFPNLQAVFNLGAGVDGILKNPYLPKHIDIIRLENAGMAEQMNEYFAYYVLHYHRHMDRYQAQQAQSQWLPHSTIPASNVRIGILGLGQLGASVANCLKQFGFQVKGWSRSSKQLDGIHCYAGSDQLDDFFANTDMLCNLLPLTAETDSILNYNNLKKLPQGSVLINGARGEHLVEEDLMQLLNEGHLRGAVLDTMRTEPLPQSSPLWTQKNLILTPHCAANSWLKPSATQIAKNIDALLAGQQPTGLVHRDRGY